MSGLEKNQLQQFEILKHVERSPELNNRMAAAKLGCSVKLAHALLRKMVDRGLLHVRKRHSRRWDYFLTPKGIAEKSRLTLEFLDFSFRFYHEARKASSQLCKDLASSGRRTVAFVGAGDLAEIAYLGVKEWKLELLGVYDGQAKSFIGHEVSPLSEVAGSGASAIVICLYDKGRPMSRRYLPPGLPALEDVFWIFDSEGGEGEGS